MLRAAQTIAGDGLSTSDDTYTRRPGDTRGPHARRAAEANPDLGLVLVHLELDVLRTANSTCQLEHTMQSSRHIRDDRATRSIEGKAEVADLGVGKDSSEQRQAKHPASQ